MITSVVKAASIVVLIGALAGCGSFGAERSPEPAPVVEVRIVPMQYQVMQLPRAEGGLFVICVQCPAPTTKTLATAAQKVIANCVDANTGTSDNARTARSRTELADADCLIGFAVTSRTAPAAPRVSNVRRDSPSRYASAKKPAVVANTNSAKVANIARAPNAGSVASAPTNHGAPSRLAKGSAVIDADRALVTATNNVAARKPAAPVAASTKPVGARPLAAPRETTARPDTVDVVGVVAASEPTTTVVVRTTR